VPPPRGSADEITGAHGVNKRVGSNVVVFRHDFLGRTKEPLLTKMAESTTKLSAGVEYKRSVSRALCSAVREPTLESLEASANKVGLHVVQVWKAPRGEGFKAVAARFIVDAEDVLIVAFRATFGNDEWLEYPQKYWKKRFIAHDGCPERSELRVFGVWSLTLDEVRGGAAASSPSSRLAVLVAHVACFHEAADAIEFFSRLPAGVFRKLCWTCPATSCGISSPSSHRSVHIYKAGLEALLFPSASQ